MSIEKKELDPMTVADLIEALRLMPQDAIVVTEGCDCDGDVGVVLGPDPERKTSSLNVMIGRTDGFFAKAKLAETETEDDDM